MQLKKNTKYQIDQISAQVKENFMVNNLDEKKFSGFS